MRVGREVVDLCGAPVVSSEAEAVAHLGASVAELIRFGPDAAQSLQAALQIDPDLTLGHALAGYYHLFRYTPAGTADARQSLERVDHLVAAGAAGPRERAHARALRHWCDGQLRAAIGVWEEIALAEPNDLLAVRLAQDGYYFLGDARNLRDSPARVMARRAPDAPMAVNVQAMHAFGLEESGHYEQAEKYALATAFADPHDVWAHHCMAHVYEMQGRLEEGIAYMDRSGPFWRPSGFPKHMWWHLGLFQIEVNSLEAAQAIYDDHLTFDAETAVVELVDAAGLLWRLALNGVELGDRARALADAFEPHVADATYSFNDVHAALAFALDGREDAGDALLEAMTSRSVGDNAQACQRAGLAIVRGLLAFGRGDDNGTLDELLEARYDSVVIGGSIAQRDILNLTVIAAASRAGNTALVEALVGERISYKPRATEPIARLVAAQAGDYERC